jgi:hypothetical protein
MSHMKYQPHDRSPTSEILAEFAALLADVARERLEASQAAPQPTPRDVQERPSQ